MSNQIKKWAHWEVGYYILGCWEAFGLLKDEVGQLLGFKMLNTGAL